MTPYYERDNIRIYCADCRDVLAEIGPVDLVLTDPPYAIGGSRNEWRVTASVAIGLNMAARTVRKGGALLAFTTSSGRGISYTLSAVGNTLPFNRVLTWHKSFIRSRVAGPWRWDTVQILAFGRASFGRPQYSSVFTSSGPSTTKALGGTGHPAELPDGIADWLYRPFAETAEVVLDPFLGTGQLLAPAVRAGKRAIGIELEERYCQIAVQRLTACLEANQEPLQLALAAGT